MQLGAEPFRQGRPFGPSTDATERGLHSSYHHLGGAGFDFSTSNHLF